MTYQRFWWSLSHRGRVHYWESVRLSFLRNKIGVYLKVLCLHSQISLMIKVTLD